MNNAIILVARLLLAQLFLLAGLSKISGYAATQAYMEGMGVPSMLLPLVKVCQVWVWTLKWWYWLLPAAQGSPFLSRPKPYTKAPGGVGHWSTCRVSASMRISGPVFQPGTQKSPSLLTAPP